VESRDSETAGPRPLRGVRARRDRRRGGASSWIFWITALLTVFAFVQAVLLFPMLFPGGPSEAAFAPEQNLPDREVRILLGDGLLLKTPLDSPEADAIDAADLDARLFPDGPRHRYFLLCLKAPEGEEAATIDLASEPLVLEGKGGEIWRPLDLALVLARRGGEMPAYLRLSVWSLLPTDGHVTVPAGGWSRLLFALPGEVDPARVERARIGDRVLTPVTMTKDELDALLEESGTVLKAEAGKR